MSPSPSDPPRVFGSPLGSASFKSQPEDFQVEELLGFRPSGEGEHCFLWVEKVGLNSNELVTHLAGRLGIRRRLVSHCGLKDKNAITRQWFSIHLPGCDSPAAGSLEGDGIRVLKVTRNHRKLRRGSHDGNRFTIRLRDCQFTPELARARWSDIVSRGVPNYFGSQRFGHGGDNIRQAREMFAGTRPVRDRMLRGLLISAARSLLFNAVVAARVEEEIWDLPKSGEVYGFADNRSLILPGRERGDEAQRVATGELQLTAPLWGQGELLSQAEIRDLEERIASAHPDMRGGLEALNLRQERRVTRLIPRRASLEWADGSDLKLTFDLPKGCYATTVLRELAQIDVEFAPGAA